ncbi:MAG: hypothetical protein FJY67_07310 [Calditrichaeota bacterium]|nr:hypothetical protein [Calditrichota bacterium]
MKLSPELIRRNFEEEKARFKDQEQSQKETRKTSDQLAGGCLGCGGLILVVILFIWLMSQCNSSSSNSSNTNQSHPKTEYEKWRDAQKNDEDWQKYRRERIGTPPPSNKEIEEFMKGVHESQKGVR